MGMKAKQNGAIAFLERNHPKKIKGIIAGIFAGTVLVLVAVGISTTSRDLNAGLSE